MTCTHTCDWVSDPVTAENQMPEHRCSECGEVMIPGLAPTKIEPGGHYDEPARPTLHEIRELADLVRPGECITFPNGITVDKRIQLPASPPAVPWSPVTYPPAFPPPTPGWQGNTCSACGMRMEGAMGYVCGRMPCPSGMGSPVSSSTSSSAHSTS